MLVFGEGGPGNRDSSPTTRGISGQEESESSRQFKKGQTGSNHFRPVKNTLNQFKLVLTKFISVQTSLNGFIKTVQTQNCPIFILVQ